ncbi:MAG TPA: 5'-methylthioadenosine/S-adenosylhomocysteine nucleosidase [Kofleriaceae bacterium]|nr:5'-methylthioadenosine/S-adenosylhomocysteine nucleosidase [Kofleriaceae bacterium]
MGRRGLQGLIALVLAACHAQPRQAQARDVVVLVSANSEWRAVERVVSGTHDTTPVGETLEASGLLYLHGGWGKIDAAASAQYAIDRWHPRLLVNLGTCGGFAGAVKPDDVVLVERTVVYDIVERMGDPKEAIDDYATTIDLAWLHAPPGLVRGTIVSADQDLDPARLGELASTYHAVAADWESGSIARVAAKNHTRVLILRGVSDVVSAAGDATYGNLGSFDEAAQHVMAKLVALLQSSLASQPLPARSIE